MEDFRKFFEKNKEKSFNNIVDKFQKILQEETEEIRNKYELGLKNELSDGSINKAKYNRLFMSQNKVAVFCDLEEYFLKKY